MNALTEESGIPHAIAAVVARFAGRVERFFPADSSADILAGKLVHRLGGAAVVEPRDLFDLLVAERHDPNALRQATGLLTRNQLAEISAMLLMLPRKWASISEKQVLSVSGERRDVDPIAVVDLLGRFAGPTPGPPGKRRLEP